MPRVDEMLHFLGMLEPKHQKSYNVHLKDILQF